MWWRIGWLPAIPLIGFFVLQGCEERAPVSQTKSLLDVLHSGLVGLQAQCQAANEDPFVDLPANASRTNYLNWYLLRQMSDRNLLDMKALAKLRNLAIIDGKRCLVDSWGRPIIFQVPSVCPSGLTYTTAKGCEVVKPLNGSLWDTGKCGAVQVWSLGPDGEDDAGIGDDILP